MNTNQNKSAEALKSDNQSGINNHKETASHLENAAKHYLDADKYQEDGELDKASKSTITAHGHIALANEMQREDTKRHANIVNAHSNNTNAGNSKSSASNSSKTSNS